MCVYLSGVLETFLRVDNIIFLTLTVFWWSYFYININARLLLLDFTHANFQNLMLEFSNLPSPTNIYRIKFVPTRLR